MFLDTGGLSFWLGVFFIFMSLTGVIVIYFIVKSKTIPTESIDKIIELGKWFIVSIAITLSASIINDSFREREQDIKEMQVFEKYVDIVLQADSLDKRKALCEYFAAVSPEGPIKTSWENYKGVVDSQIAEVKEDKARIIVLKEKEDKGEIAPSEIVEKVRLEEKTSAITRSLTSTSGQEWAIIAGSDATFESAEHEVKRIETAGFTADIYMKRSRFRTIVGPFSSRTEASSVLPEIKSKVRDSSYLVNLASWCVNPQPRTSYTECAP